jgi:hypothetical protein
MVFVSFLQGLKLTDVPFQQLKQAVIKMPSLRDWIVLTFLYLKSEDKSPPLYTT